MKVFIPGDNIGYTPDTKHIVFKKDEAGMRGIDRMPEPDINILIENESIHKEKGIKLIGVVGHIGHIGARILETLNTHHDFPENVIIVSEAHQMPNSVDLSLAGVAQKLQQELVIELTAVNRDIENILEREAKPKYDIYSQQHANHQKIKPHKAKHTIPIRKTQRKK